MLEGVLAGVLDGVFEGVLEGFLEGVQNLCGRTVFEHAANAAHQGYARGRSCTCSSRCIWGCS